MRCFGDDFIGAIQMKVEHVTYLEKILHDILARKLNKPILKNPAGILASQCRVRYKGDKAA